MLTPNAKEILADWLKANGYGGLFSEGDCGCSIDDLMPCGQCSPFCQAGYLVSCCECESQEHCSFGQEYDYMISSKRGSCVIEPEGTCNADG